jgi:phospholipid-binding lipoprotein MlaA
MLKTLTELKLSRFLFAALLMGALTACAIPPSDDKEAMAAFEETNDPFEPANRLIFSANVAVDQLVLQPAAVTYRDLFPDELKIPVENFITNLFMPLSFLHSLLQGDMERANLAATRFFTALPTFLLANTIPDKDPVFEDAGQTLAVWGFEQGPYVMLPLIGPSSVRDTFGTIGDFFFDPVGWVTGNPVPIGRATSNAVVVRSNNVDQVRDIQRNSLDYYAAVRSLYRQQRGSQIRNGGSTPVQGAPTLGLDMDEGSGTKETASGK